jgi:hypothetical protein
VVGTSISERSPGSAGSLTSTRSRSLWPATPNLSRSRLYTVLAIVSKKHESAKLGSGSNSSGSFAIFAAIRRASSRYQSLRQRATIATLLGR